MIATIRSMRPDEVDQVAALLLRCNDEHLREFPAEVAAAYRRDLADVGGRLGVADVVVAEIDGRLVGSVTLIRDAADDNHPWPPGGVVLRLLAVDPDARGQGLARRLAERCIAEARRLGASYVGLHTALLMESARALYEKLGFVRAPDHDFDPAATYGGRPEDMGDLRGLAYLLPLGEGSR